MLKKLNEDVQKVITEPEKNKNINDTESQKGNQKENTGTEK